MLLLANRTGLWVEGQTLSTERTVELLENKGMLELSPILRVTFRKPNEHGLQVAD